MSSARSFVTVVLGSPTERSSRPTRSASGAATTVAPPKIGELSQVIAAEPEIRELAPQRPRVSTKPALAGAPAGGRELGEQQRSLPGPSRELVPTSVPTFPWRRETPGYASKRSTYRNL